MTEHTPDLDPSSVEELQPSENDDCARRACALCGSKYTPKKHNQDYCTKRCRRRSLAVRTKAARLAKVLEVQPPLSLAVAVRALNRARKAANLPPAERSAYLNQYAGVLEAREQVKRWQDLLADRCAKLDALEAPALRAELQIVRFGSDVQIDANATHYGTATTDSGIAVLALGFQPL